LFVELNRGDALLIHSHFKFKCKPSPILILILSRPSLRGSLQQFILLAK